VISVYNRTMPSANRRSGFARTKVLKWGDVV
jgi:hypothetical protein